MTCTLVTLQYLENEIHAAQNPAAARGSVSHVRKSIHPVQRQTVH
jgi:hypothetical protein